MAGFGQTVERRAASRLLARMHLLSLLRWGVALVFLTAGVAKVMDYPGLLTSLSRIPIPNSAVRPAGALLIALELAVAAILMLGREVWAGAALGGVMAIAFIALTGAKLLQGIPSTCSCFGAFLKMPPKPMLIVDLLLLLACLALMRPHSAGWFAGNARSRSAPAGEGPSGHAPLRWPAVGRQAALFWLSAYVVSMGLLTDLGFDRMARAAAPNERQVMALHYGDPAPQFTITSDHGGKITLADLQGRPTLLVFVRPMCQPCEDELHDIERRYSSWKRRLSVLIVLEGRPLLGAPEVAAQRFARDIRLWLPIAIDPNLRMTSRYCDWPLHTPFSVLLDRRGVVTFVQDGRYTDQMSLVNAIDAILSDRPRVPLLTYLRRPATGRRAPDGQLRVAGKTLRLSQLWRARPLLLSFVLEGCSACEDRENLMERALGAYTGLKRVYVYPNFAQAEEAARALRTRALVAADTNGSLYRAYRVWHAPTTVLVRDGRVTYSPDESPTPRSLERLLRLNMQSAPSTPLVWASKTEGGN